MLNFSLFLLKLQSFAYKMLVKLPVIYEDDDLVL